MPPASYLHTIFHPDYITHHLPPPPLHYLPPPPLPSPHISLSVRGHCLRRTNRAPRRRRRQRWRSRPPSPASSPEPPPSSTPAPGPPSADAKVGSSASSFHWTLLFSSFLSCFRVRAFLAAFLFLLIPCHFQAFLVPSLSLYTEFNTIRHEAFYFKKYYILDYLTLGNHQLRGKLYLQTTRFLVMRHFLLTEIITSLLLRYC
jgi:hypothetical protein